MTSVETPVAEQARGQGEQRFVLRSVDWDAYRKVSDALKGRHLHLTYDRGTLELMTISPLHGNCSRLLGRLIVTLTEELGLPVRAFGDMACDREDLERGVEPDECFYLENEPRVRDKDAIDLRTDPPPDLVAEIDISRSSRRRLGVYGALGVPEVWRYDGEVLQVLRRDAQGEYQVVQQSLHFPRVPVQELAQFLARRNQTDDNSLVREFHAWVRQQLAANQPRGKKKGGRGRGGQT
jgi:Uma2 family endonuclease